MLIKPTSVYQLSIILGLLSSQWNKIIKFAKEVLFITHDREVHDQSCVEIYTQRKEQEELRNLEFFFLQMAQLCISCVFHNK